MSPTKSEIPVRQFRVIKVGGSLFTLPDLKDRIIAWASSIADESFVDVWIPGGGGLVDEVRNWQSRHGLTEEQAHRISIGMMSQTAKLFHTMFDDWAMEHEHSALPSYLNGQVSPDNPVRNIVFDCSRWADSADSADSNTSLDRSWQTTSDSISLAVAASLNARQLCLLKSATPDSESARYLAKHSFVDANFASLCLKNPEIAISYTNLRQSIETFELRNVGA